MAKLVNKIKKFVSSKNCTLCLLVVLLIGVLVYFFSNKLKESFVNDDKILEQVKN